MSRIIHQFPKGVLHERRAPGAPGKRRTGRAVPPRAGSTGRRLGESPSTMERRRQTTRAARHDHDAAPHAQASLSPQIVTPPPPCPSPPRDTAVCSAGSSARERETKARVGGQRERKKTLFRVAHLRGGQSGARQDGGSDGGARLLHETLHLSFAVSWTTYPARRECVPAFPERCHPTAFSFAAPSRGGCWLGVSVSFRALGGTSSTRDAPNLGKRSYEV